MTAALVRTGVVTVCCGGHRPAGCCDENCRPCCPECVACPEVHQLTPEQRAANARVFRERRLVAGVLAERARQRPALAAVEELAEAIESYGRATVAAVDEFELQILSALDLIDAFEPDMLEAARSAVSRRPFPHMEGSVT